MKPTLYNTPKIAVKCYRNFFQLTLLIICFSIAAYAQTIQTATDGMTPSGLKAGTPAGSYSLSGFENVNPYNGNLNFTMPLLKVGGRGGAQYTITLSLNSIHWRAEKDKITCDREGEPPLNGNWRRQVSSDCGSAANYYYSNPNNWQDDIRAGYSPGVLVGRHTGKGGTLMSPYFTTTLTRLTFITADGTEYELRDIDTNGQIKTGTSPGYNRGKVFVTRDGSAATFISNEDIFDERNPGFSGVPFYPSGVLLLSDGTRYEIVNGRVKIMRDTNGNYIRFIYEVEPVNNIVDGRVIQIVDSLNRTVDISYTPTGDTITYKGFGGATRSIQILRDNLADVLRPNSNYQIRSFQYLFTPSQGFSNSSSYYDPENLAKEIILPDNRSYKLYYNEYGEFSRFETPTGAAIEYDYTAPSDSVISSINGPQIHRRVTERRLYPNGSTGNTYESKQTYAAVYSGDGTSSNPWKTVATIEQRDSSNNLLSKDKHYYDGSPTASLIVSAFRLSLYGGWNEGKETKTEVYDLNGSTVLRTSENFYQQRENISWWSSHATGNNLTAADEPANDPRLIRTESTLNDTGQKTKTETAYDDFNNPIEVKEYDYGTGGNFGSMLRRTVTSYVTSSTPINGIDYICATAQTCGSNPIVHIRRLARQRSVYDTNGTEKARTVYEYDNYLSDSRHASLTSRSNATGSCFLFNSQNNEWSCTTVSSANHYPRGNLTGIISYPNISNLTEYITASAQYDVLGNIVKTIDARGYSTTLNYSDCFGTPDGNVRNSTQCNGTTISQLNGLQTFALVTSASNPLGHTSYAQYDYNLGAAVDGEDINGVVSSGYYNDTLDRPTQIIRAANISSLKNQTSFIYDDSNRKVTTMADVFSFNDNLSKSEQYSDKAGRVTEIRSYKPDGDYTTTQMEYDALSRVKRATNPHRPLQNEVPLWSKTKYDTIGRTIEIETPDNTKSLTNYLGNRVTTIDRANKQKRSIYNALGQLVRIDEPNDAGDAGDIDDPYQPTFYKYDTNGQLVEVTQGNQQRYFLYDSLGRLLRVRQPEQEVNFTLNTTANSNNNEWTAGFSYDENGNMLTATDAKGITITRSYDNLNRTLTQTYSDGTPTITYKYDEANVPYSKGRLTEVSNSISTSRTTAFDVLGRQLIYQQITDGITYTSTYQYNLNGTLIQENYPSGRKIRNDFGIEGKLARVFGEFNGQTKTYANSISCLPTGAIERMKLGNGLWETAKYNSRQQITELGLGNSSANSEIWRVKYEYGKVEDDGSLSELKNTGNIARQTISLQELAQPFVHTYKYDTLNRLIEAKETRNNQQNWKQAWTYDRYGNRNNFSQIIGSEQLPISNLTNPSINPSTNRFNAGQGYVYDKNGNLIQDAQGRTFTFNGDNKQVLAKDSNQNIIGFYYYDGEGKRVKKITNSETTIFVYSTGRLIAEYSTQTSQTPQTNYLTLDNLGTPRVITNQSGQVISRRDFMPFGEELYAGVGGRTTTLKYSAIGQDNIRQRFTGYQKDTETGLDFAEARYYYNQHGRFTAVDPLLASGKSANPQTFNRYVYVINNPLLRIDANGLQPSELSFSAFVEIVAKNFTSVTTTAGQTGNIDREAIIQVAKILFPQAQEIYRAAYNSQRSLIRANSNNGVTATSEVAKTTKNETTIPATTMTNSSSITGEQSADATGTISGSATGSTDGTASGTKTITGTIREGVKIATTITGSVTTPISPQQSAAVQITVSDKASPDQQRAAALEAVDKSAQPLATQIVNSVTYRPMLAIGIPQGSDFIQTNRQTPLINFLPGTVTPSINPTFDRVTNTLNAVIGLAEGNAGVVPAPPPRVPPPPPPTQKP